MTAEVQPRRNGNLDEKCAWLRRREARRRALRPSLRWVSTHLWKRLRPLGRRAPVTSQPALAERFSRAEGAYERELVQKAERLHA